MAPVWMRECQDTTVSSGSDPFAFGLKCLAIFLQRCLGYTHTAETGNSFFSTENFGVNGSINISGTDKILRDTVNASFVASDVGKWLVIRDIVNPKNSGIYEVTAQTATTLTFDFRTGAAEYPTQNLNDNLNWWLFASNFETPTGGYFRLRTPDSAGWEIECTYLQSGGTQRVAVRVAVDGDWSGSKILSTTYHGSLDNNANWFYCVADSLGKYINFFFENATSSRYHGFVVDTMTPTEPGRDPSELVALMGSSSSTGYWQNSSYDREHWDTTALTTGSIWSEWKQAVIPVSMLGLSYYLSTDCFTSWASRQINQRRGDWDVIAGQPIVADKDAAYAPSQFEIVGVLPSIFLCSENAGALTEIDDEGTKDRFHVIDGHAVEWPGFTPQH